LWGSVAHTGNNLTQGALHEISFPHGGLSLNAGTDRLAAAPLPPVHVYKSPACGCCDKWVDHMKASGFEVVTHDTHNVVEHKTRLGVPVAMGSCHTAEVGGYLTEGHVPATDVKRLLAEMPSARGRAGPAGRPVRPVWIARARPSTKWC
jgi:hypothetical protein